MVNYLYFVVIILICVLIWCFIGFKINSHFSTIAKLYALQWDNALNAANKKEEVKHFIFNTFVKQ